MPDKEEVWKLLAELIQSQKETDKEMRKTDKEIRKTTKEIKELRKIQSAYQKEMEKERKEREMERKERERERRERERERIEREKEREMERAEREKERREWERERKEWERERKEWEKERKELDRRIGKWIDGWGSFIEGMAAPSIPKIFKKFDINVVGTYLDAARHKNGKTMEIDILCVGKKNTGKRVVIVVEMKSRLRITDVKEFTKKLPNFLQFFDEYEGSEIIGVTGGMRIDKGVLDYAEKLGVCVIAPSEDVMTLLNSEEFKPKIWSST